MSICTPSYRKGWKIWYASSEELAQEQAPAENMLDGKPETYWHSEWGNRKPKHPFVVVVDMGDIQSDITGIRQTPRKDRPNGRIRAIRVYARPQFFLAR